MQKIWNIKQSNIELSARIAAKLGISSMISQLLTTRGIVDEQSAEEFLYPRIDMMYDPFQMHGMERAVERIKQAIERGEQIWIYGDYDVDGTTATALLLSVFRHLGVQASYYIPNRFDEGYGLNTDATEKLGASGCDVLITVDCGVSSITEVERANELGIDVIVTDHHEPKEGNIPPAYVVLNPRLEVCEYPFDGLAGVGVAFKLAHALLGVRTGELPPALTSQLDLVALGTVVDVAMLVDENRILSRIGLAELNKRERPGIRALCDAANVTSETEIKSYTLGFVLGPRLNAAGRLDTARKVVELLTTESYDYALEIAKELDAANRERQDIEQKILRHARDKVKRSVNLKREKALVLADEEWHQGVIGIVASRLVEQYYRPTLLIALNGDEGHGSGRSIPEFNLFEGLNECRDLMLGFGGHKAAAGFSITKDNIPKLRDKFSQVVAASLSEEDLTPKVNVDLPVSLSQVTTQAIEEFKLLEPFGLGNPRPVLSIMDASLKGEPNLFGKNRDHLKFLISDGKKQVDTIGWRMANRLVALKNKSITVDLAFHPEINEWRNTRNVRLTLDDINIHSSKGKRQIIFPPLAVPSSVKFVDRRDCNKREYLQKLFARNEPTLLYVRDDDALQQLSVIFAEQFRETDADDGVALCDSKMNDEQRQAVLAQLERGQLHMVASSIILKCFPYVKHLVLCHPVHTWDIFSECCKPAFDTEETMYIHLIFGTQDFALMHDMLNWEYPKRETLMILYQLIGRIAQESGSPVALDELIKQADAASLKEQTVMSGITIFEELQLIERVHDSETTIIRVLPKPQEKRGLHESECFLNGEHLKQEALSFSDVLLKKTAEELWGKLNEDDA